MTDLTSRSAVKIAAAAAAAPWVIPSRVLGAHAPSNTLRIGCIGTGRRGRQVMRSFVHNGLSDATPARIAAVCDVDSTRLAEAVRGIATWHEEKGSEPLGDIGRHADFRELLAQGRHRRGDHHHARALARALPVGRRGQGRQGHLRREAPDLLASRRAASSSRPCARTSVMLQVGSQQRSDRQLPQGLRGRPQRPSRQAAARSACQLPRDHGVGGTTRPTPSLAPRLSTCGWGRPRSRPTPSTASTPQSGYGRPGWLQIERYCLGMITGWGSHMNDIAQWGHGGDTDSGPVEIEARGEFPDRGLFDVHTDYPRRGPLRRRRRRSSSDRQPGRRALRGRRRVDLGPARRARGRAPRTCSRRSPRAGPCGSTAAPTTPRTSSSASAAARSRSAPSRSAIARNSVCMLTHIAMKLGRKLRWDPAAERFIDDDEANAHARLPAPAPWVMS